MTSRMNFSDARWFSEKRPSCVVENQFKNRLGATSDTHYKDLLVYDGLKTLDTIKKVPQVKVKSIDKKDVNAATISFYDTPIDQVVLTAGFCKSCADKTGASLYS